MTQEKLGKYLDGFGMAASWACAAQCLALPLLVGVLPLVGLSFLLAETTELALIGVSALIAAASLLPAYFRRHGKLRSIYLAAAGIGLIVLTHVLFEDNLIAKIIFLIAGAVLLTSAHLLNRRLCRECEVCRTVH